MSEVEKKDEGYAKRNLEFAEMDSVKVKGCPLINRGEGRKKLQKVSVCMTCVSGYGGFVDAHNRVIPVPFLPIGAGMTRRARTLLCSVTDWDVAQHEKRKDRDIRTQIESAKAKKKAPELQSSSGPTVDEVTVPDQDGEVKGFDAEAQTGGSPEPTAFPLTEDDQVPDDAKVGVTQTAGDVTEAAEEPSII